MSVLFRARLSSFLSGVGLASAVCMFQLKRDIDESYSLVLEAMKEETMSLKDRLSQLEQRVGLPKEV